ncbi:MAG: helix-turn-helix transcriptional regulator [Acidobacteriota bacterium]
MSGRLRDLEYTLLLALLRLGDEAYGVPIRDEIASRTGRELSLGALYTTLERLEGKGYIESRMGAPTAVRGGRRKKMCRLTSAGKQALSQTWDFQRRMTEGLEPRLEELRRNVPLSPGQDHG